MMHLATEKQQKKRKKRKEKKEKNLLVCWMGLTISKNKTPSFLVLSTKAPTFHMLLDSFKCFLVNMYILFKLNVSWPTL